MSNRVSKTVSDDILNRIIQIESAGEPLAEAETSTATGLFQPLESTWLNLVRIHRPEWAQGRTRTQVLDLREDPNLNIILGGCLTEDNQRAIGVDCTPGDLYLAHFLGPADAKDLFKAHPDTPVSALVSQSVINANRQIMQGRNAGQVRAWAARKMAQPAHEDWIGKYFTGDGPGDVITPKPAAKPKPTPKPVSKPAESPIPDSASGQPVDVPLPPERPDPVPQVEPAPEPEKPVKKAKEGFGDWCGRKWRTVTSTIGGSFSLGFLGYLTDWKVLATLMVGGLIIGLVIYFIYSREHRNGDA